MTAFITHLFNEALHARFRVRAEALLGEGLSWRRAKTPTFIGYFGALAAPG
ncbi:MAG: hypothetical protein Q8N44_17660 [Rubrivivax sp.]|nr:hypothetical protein [Rubrivivax sp.]